MRRRAWRGLAMTMLLLVPPAGAQWARAGDAGEAATPTTPAPIRRGIILMTVDSLRTDRLGCHPPESSITPAMDRLARSGICYNRAYTASVSTAPSVASLMTGLEPALHGLRSDRNGRLNPGVTTLAESLHAAGWATAAVIGTELLDSQRGLARGFDQYDDDITGVRKLVFALSKERRASEVAERGLAALDALPSDRPFFLWLHFHDPHFDYDPDEAKRKDYPNAPYDGEVSAVDDAVGAVVSGVRGRLPDGRLTFVLAGTHGEGFGGNDEVGHGFYLHETTVRVPLVVVSEAGRSPGGGTERTPVSLLDVAPTLMAVAGVQPPAGVHGRVLDSVANPPGTAEPAGKRQHHGRSGRGARRIYLEAAAPYLDYGWSPLVAMIEGDRKVVLTPGGRVDAFDLAADPAGTRALAKRPRWAADLAGGAIGLLGSLDPPPGRRQEIAAAVAEVEFPWGNSPFCAAKSEFPDPRDPERVALSAILFPARVESDQGIPGWAGKAGMQVVEKDPTNLTALELIVILSLKNRWYSLLLDPLEMLTCDYPYREEGYHYLGHYYSLQRDMPRALEAFRLMALVDPDDEEAEYDIACTYAALDMKDEAFEHLRRSIDLGARDFTFMSQDGRLGPLRNDPRFAALISSSDG